MRKAFAKRADAIGVQRLVAIGELIVGARIPLEASRVDADPVGLGCPAPLCLRQRIISARLGSNRSSRGYAAEEKPTG